ncbi:mucin-2-like [Colletes gigas]|uniref:mucin-2-like n=1 Tax=Colletes gigas TaxID=935657 RepID=UPI001C9B4C6E|nr:mucin-2-like [Colletes gigas]
MTLQISDFGFDYTVIARVDESIYLAAIIAAVTVTSVTPDEFTDEFADIPTSCPVPDGQDTTHIAHESDCHKFYKCKMGQKYEMTCRSNLCFNPELQVCDWPWNVTCCMGGISDPPTSPSTTTQSTTTQSTTTQSTTTQSTTTQSTTTQSTTTQSTTTQSTTTPNPTPTSTTTESTTTESTTTTSTTPKPPPSDGNDCATLKNGVRVPDETNCRKYYECKAGIYLVAIIAAVTVASVAPDEFADEFANIPKNECPKVDGQNVTQIPHESDCHKFYKCKMGQKVEMTCPKNLCFNPELQVCDWPENVPCCAGGIPDTSITQSTTTQDLTTQPPTTQPPTTQLPTSQPPTTQDPTTQPPTTQSPTTQDPTTQPPTTQPPTTQPPTTQPPTTQDPTTQPSTTQPPTTQPPTTQPPTTQPPTTQGPTTQDPTTQPPTTQPPTTQDSTTQPPTTQPPTTQPPTTQPPTTQPPTTQPPTTQPPTTQPPTTQPPTTQPPTTQPPTTQPPTTLPPPTDDDDCARLKNGDRVPDETNCRKYYECKAGRRTGPFDCLENLYFNPIVSECDVASNVPAYCSQ